MTFPQQPGFPGEPGQQPYQPQPDPYVQQAFSPTPASGPPIQLGPPPPGPQKPSRMPWIVAGVTSFIAVASLVASIIMVTGDDQPSADKKTEPADETAPAAAYILTQGLCGELDVANYEDVVKPEEEMSGHPSKVNELSCRATTEDYGGRIAITIGTAPDRSEAEDSYEQLKGELYDDSGLEEVQGDWDQGEMVTEDIFGVTLLVQDANLYLGISIGGDEVNVSDAEDAALAVAEDIMKKAEPKKDD